MRHTKELFDLAGRVAIVTGGRGLYGTSISLGLCEMGATVVIASRNGEKCEEYAKSLREQGYDAWECHWIFPTTLLSKHLPMPYTTVLATSTFWLITR